MTAPAAPALTAPPGVTWRISEEGGAWQVYRDDAPLGDPQPGYPEAVAAIREALAAEAPEVASPDGLLAEAWTSPAGIAFAEATGDGRDFTGVAWSWRDPAASTLPLMFQDQTDMGHFGARLAGHLTSLSQTGGTVHAEGRFYDSDTGRAARDLLLGGRSFGVSVDPGAVEAEWACLSEDDDGWCTEELITFGAYEVIGLTMTPFPAFANAAISLAAGSAELAVAPADHAFTDDNGDGKCDACLAEDQDGNCTQVCDLTENEHQATPPPAEEASVVVTAASATLLTAPPAAWFHLPEPTELGELIDQGDGTWAMPLTITDDGQVYGHVARWGQCHTGYAGRCVSPPSSASGYRDFHVGSVRTAEGDTIPVGCLTIGADHAPSYLRAAGAQDHYAHAALAWADVRASDGMFGPWVAGALRPDVTPELLRVLRASTLSGDWRSGEMVAALAVNTPGFPILREAITASGLPDVADVRPAARLSGGEAVTLTAAGMVRRCPDCARRAASGAPSRPGSLDADRVARIMREALSVALAPLVADLARVERRTRHLRDAEAATLRRRVTKL
jgi:hypothetical protein